MAFCDCMYIIKCTCTLYKSNLSFGLLSAPFTKIALLNDAEKIYI